MKKIFASLTALACAATIFTGCGKVDDDDDKKDSGKKGSSTASSDELEDVLNDIIDAAKNKDINAIIRNGLPDELADSVRDLFEDELDDLAGGFSDEYAEGAADVQIISIKKTEDMDENYILLLEKAFSVALTFTEYMEENDLTYEDMENMDKEDLLNTPLGDIARLAESLNGDIDSPEDLIDSGILDKIDSKITITEGCMAEVTVKSDGETESMELPFYYIKGEGWNSDMIFYPSMIGYVNKSKKVSANSAASQLKRTAECVLADLEYEEDIDIYGNYIISSDENFNYNLSRELDKHLDDFYDSTKDYFYDIDKYDYFIVVMDGYIKYAACKKKGDDVYTGTYPYSTIPTGYDGYDIETKSMDNSSDYTYEDIYDMALSIVK